MTLSSSPAAPGAPLVPVLVVVGVGLIGGSFAAALRQVGQVGKVIGVGRQVASLERARDLGLIDEFLPLDQAVAQADLVLLSVPVGATEATLAALLPHLPEHAVVTDVGSTKRDVVAAAQAAMGDRINQFVPGHPIAGSEQSGPDAAQTGLYQGRDVILTPLPQNTRADVEFVQLAWELCGAEVRLMTPALHDRALASVSHVPHLLAFAYMGQVIGAPDTALRLDLAGSGFRDFTRIAGGSPDMWRDIFLANHDVLLDEVAQVRGMLDMFERAIRHGDTEQLTVLLQAISSVRRNWGEAHAADTPAASLALPDAAPEV
jgi:prephenate dehydrogenase